MADHIDIQDKAFEVYPTEPWNFERLKDRCFICQPAVFFRRRMVGHHGLLDESLNYCMDYEYWLRLGRAGVKFDYLEEKIAGSRLYTENKTLGMRVKVHREINNMFRRKFGKVPDRWLMNYAHAVVEKTKYGAVRSKLFVVLVALVSIFASMKWNKTISQSMLREIRPWFDIFGKV